MSKTIFLDLQNTIIGSSFLLDDYKLEALKKISSKNHIIVTSNIFPSDIHYFLNINNLDLDFIASSGTYLSLNKKIYKESFKLNLDIFNNHKKDMYFLFYEQDEVFHIYNYEERLHAIYPIKPKDTKIIKEFSNKIDTFEEILICLKKDSDILHLLFNLTDISLHIIAQDHTKILYKITKKDINKGHFVDFIIKNLNLDIKDTIGAGDSLEDLPVLNRVNLKIVPKNADDILKARADLILPTYLENGILDYLVNNT